MIKVSDDGEIEIYPKTQPNIFGSFAYLFVIPVIIIMGCATRLFYQGYLPYLVMFFAGLIAFVWMKYHKNSKPLLLNTGMYRVSQGHILQLIGTQVAHQFYHDGNDAEISKNNDQFQLNLYNNKNNKKPLVIFAGIESKREAEVMLATLKGKKISIRKKKITMKSTDAQR